MMSGAATLTLSVTARSGSFRRGGMAFGKEPVLLAIGPDQAELFLTLVKERELICQARWGEEDDFLMITDDDVAQIEIGLKFWTEQVVAADTNSPAATSNTSTAPGASAVQGDDASKTETEAATPPSGEEQPAADSAPAPVAAQAIDSVNPTEATGDDAKEAAATTIGDDRNDGVEKPGANAAVAPVASTTKPKPSGRKAKAVPAAEPAEAKAAS